MKLPKVDIGAATYIEWTKNVGFKNRFLKYWGHDDSVLTEKQYYYPKVYLEQNKKLFKLLKMYDTLNDQCNNMEGIVLAWVYLNPSKTSITPLIADSLASQLNSAIPTDKYVIYDVGISYQRPYSRYNRFSGMTNLEAPIVDTVLGTGTEESMSTYIKEKWQYIHNKYNILPDNTDEVSKAISLCALYGDVAELDTKVTGATRNVVEKSYTQVNENYSGNSKTTKIPYLEVMITFKLRVKRLSTIGTDSPIVKHMMEDKDQQTKDAAVALQEAKWNSSTFSWGKPLAVTNKIFLNNQLRKSVFSVKESGIKSKTLNETLGKMLDSDYQKKKTKWWKKWIGIIIAVAVVVYTGGTGAGSAAAIMGSTTVTVATVALQFTFAALALSLTSMAMASWGDPTGAAAVAKIAKGVGLVSSVLGITAMVQNVLTQTATNAVTREAAVAVLKAEGTKVTESAITTQMTKMFVNNSINSIQEAVSKQIQKMTEMSLGNVLTQLNRVAGLVLKNKMKDVDSESNRIREGLEEQRRIEAERLKEESEHKDLAAAYIASYTNELRQDQGRYNFDYPYEPTDYNMGKQYYPVIMSSPVDKLT